MTHTNAEADRWLAENFPDWVLALEPRVETMACTGVVLSIPVKPAIARQDGIVPGPALAVFAETTMVIACARHFRDFRPVETLTLDLQFLRPAKGDRIVCSAALVRTGRTHIFTRAVLTAEPSGQDVAAATATFAVVA
ncbi:MAG: PaaI family thioesterase [Maritimibacter sp.]|nr:PaaI family thioesterase [Maritimibacter sp.]